jgi:hypothetical protein
VNKEKSGKSRDAAAKADFDGLERRGIRHSRQYFPKRSNREIFQLNRKKFSPIRETLGIR